MIKDKNIVVLGGGTAGWLTALYLKIIFNQCNITLIESKKIGILGAGEGSVPVLPRFLSELGLKLPEVIKSTGGTIKNGISFENWNGDGKKYFHGFDVKNILNKFKMPPHFSYGCYDYYLKNLVNNNMSFDDNTYPPLLSYQNKVDLDNMSYSYHFDAHKLAEHLKKVGQIRGINLYYDEFKNVKTDEFDNITALNFESGRSQSCDFVFDCSGFNRLLIGKYYKTKWIDYQKHLPIKKAIPFFLKQDESIKPYTQAIAMKYGWIWKIPLQHRYGAGYIFDSDYISDEDAFNEAKEMFPEIEYTRTIKFDAGRYEKVWHKNCIAVGLSTGFTEPLEATSIWIAINQLYKLLHFLPDMFSNKNHRKDLYNKITSDMNDSILNFLYFHYMTKRTDSLFWKEFRQKNKPPKDLENLINNIQNCSFHNYDLNTEEQNYSFDYKNYLQVANGLELLNKKFELNSYGNLIPSHTEYSYTLKNHIKNAVDHRQFLNSL